MIDGPVKPNILESKRKRAYPDGETMIISGFSPPTTVSQNWKSGANPVINDMPDLGFTASGPFNTLNETYMKDMASVLPIIPYILIHPDLDESDRFIDPEEPPPPIPYEAWITSLDSLDEADLDSFVQASMTTILRATANNPDNVLCIGMQFEEQRPWIKSFTDPTVAVECEYIKRINRAINARSYRRPNPYYNPQISNLERLTDVANLSDPTYMATGAGYLAVVADTTQRGGQIDWAMEQIHPASLINNSVPSLFFQLSEPMPILAVATTDDLIRHDVVRGLARGIKAIIVWSLFITREGVETVYESYLNSYGNVFAHIKNHSDFKDAILFGSLANDIPFTLISGTNNVDATVFAQFALEFQIPYNYDTVIISHLALAEQHYFIVVNSNTTPCEIEITDPLYDSVTINWFEGLFTSVTDVSNKFRIELPAFGYVIMNLQNV